MAIVNQYIPDYVSPPGETLLETIEELGISQDDLAKRISITKKEVDDIIAGKAPIMTELAFKLEKVLGIPASFWKNRERNYRDALEGRSKPQHLNFYESEITSKSMTQQPSRPNSNEDIVKIMVDKINKLSGGIKGYKIRELVEDTEKLGKRLAAVEKLKTNQIRKFLDAVNRLKAKLAKDENKNFTTIESELVFLRPKLAYAAARQQKDRDPGPVDPLKQVLEAAIKKVEDTDDFDRLVQLIEAIIAYHKAAGGKDQ